MVRLGGYEVKSIVGTRLMDYIPAPYHTLLENMLDMSAACKRSVQQVPLIKKDGTTTQVLLTMIRLDNHHSLGNLESAERKHFGLICFHFTAL
jgi:hypothetical protein